MPFGILEDKHMSMPPGTGRLDSKLSKDPQRATAGTKFKTDGDMILIPQPTDNPNDPLNWSNMWKNSLIVILGMGVAVVISLGAMITPGLPLLAKEYNVSMDKVSSAFLGSMHVASGVGMVFVAAAATIFGKRMFFVVGQVVLVATCAWGYWSKDFKSLTAMRIIQGLASAPIETLVTPTIADIFFVHQRGSRLAIWHTMIGGGVGLGHVISGFIIKYLGVSATFGIAGIVLAVLTPIIYFLVLETSFVRPKSAWNVQEETTDNGAGFERVESISCESFASEENLEKEYKVEVLEYVDVQRKVPETKQPYLQRLKLYQGIFSKEPFLKLLVKPAPLLLFPAVLYSTIVNGFHMAALIGMGLLSINILKDDPYKLDPAQLGMIGIPTMIVSFIFAPLSGFMADWVAKVLSRRNKGIFEPEFRLLLMIIAVPISTVSFVGFGIVAQEKKSLPWILFFSTLQSVSVPFASQAALTYVLDCHPRDSNPAFVAIHFAKTLFGLAATSTVSGWLEKSGPRSVFNTLATINVLISCLTFPAYIFGKRFRSYIARSKLAQKIEAH